MRAVNLLPRDVAKTTARQVSPPVLTGMVAAVVVVTVLAAGFFRESAKVSHARTDLDAARAELASIPAPAPLDSTSSTLVSEQSRRLTALQSALDGRIAWDRLLREISLVMPEDVWLNELTLQAPTAPTLVPTAGAPPAAATSTTPTSTPTSPTSASDFTMNGKAFSQVGVARLMSRLALIPDLKDVALDHSTRTDTTRHPVEFTVLAGIRAPGGTP